MKRTIKVLHIANMMKGGGVASFLMNYFRHIDRSEILFDFVSEDLHIDTYEEEINNLGGKLYIVPHYKNNFWGYIKALDKIIKPDVYDTVHCHEFVLSIIALFISRKNKIRFRYSHSHSYAVRGGLFSIIIKKILVFLSHPFFRLLSTRCFACSEDAGRYLFGNTSNFEIIHNAIYVEKYLFNKHLRTKIRSSLNISDTALLLGYVARFDKQKNHIFLIKVFSKILEKKNDAMLLLVGSGTDYQTIHDMITAYNIAEKVIFYGISDNVSELYSAMDVFVFPSLAEGLGIVGIEAQCSGLPVIASSNIPKMMQVSNLVTWLNLNDSIDEWADKVINCSLKTERKDMSEVITSAGYNISFESKKLEQIYLQNNIF